MNQPAAQGEADLSLPLLHLLAGAGALLLATALLGIDPALLLHAVGEPHALAVTHLLALGWVTITIMGASYQLVPVVLQVALYSERLARTTFWHSAPGVGLLALGFWISWPPAVVGGGAAVGAGLAMYAWNIAGTLRRVRTWGEQAYFFAVATAYLLGVGGYGLALAAGFMWPVGPGGSPLHLAFHLLLGLFGWITVLGMGVAYRLGPMFALSHGRGDGFGRPVLALVGGGLALLLAVLVLWPARSAAAGVALVPLAGVLLFLWDQWLYLRQRQRRQLDLGLRFMVVAFAYLGAASVLGWLAGAGWLRMPPAVVVILGLLGWAGSLIVGQLYKIVPFLVWHQRYSGRAGVEPVPLLRDMYSARWGELSLATFAPSPAVLAAGVLAGSAAMIEVGALAALAGALALAWNLGLILRA